MGRQVADALTKAVAPVAEEVRHKFLEWVEGVAKDADVAGDGTPISVETCEEDIITISNIVITTFLIAIAIIIVVASATASSATDAAFTS